MIRHLLAAFAALALAACAQPSAPAADLDAIARDYLLLQLTIGEKEEGYIDAYYGPPEIQAQAKANAAANDLPGLASRVAALRERIAAGPQEAGSMDERRAKFLDAQLVAAQTRLRMLQGENLPFVEEAEGLFGVRPETPALATFDPLIARIDALVPGEGPLWQRIDAFDNKFNIPADKLKPVMDAAIAECRKRTLAHYTLPEGERFVSRWSPTSRGAATTTTRAASIRRSRSTPTCRCGSTGRSISAATKAIPGTTCSTR